MNLLLAVALVLTAGEVRQPDGKPLAGARVAAHPAGASVTTDAGGRYSIDTSGASELLVSRAGFGTRIVRLPASRASVPPLTLRKGVTLRVRIERGAETGPIDVAAGVMLDGERPLWLATRTIPPDRAETTFTDLDREVYTILVSGRDPLQRLVVHAVLDEARETLEIPLREFRVAGRVIAGGAPVPSATVEVIHEPQWRTAIVADAEGRFASRAWDRRDVALLVSGGSLANKRVVQGRIAPAMEIELPGREVRGVIVDSSGAPVPRARVGMRSEEGELRTTVTLHADDAGRFRFTAIGAGRHTMQADAPGHLRSDAVTFELAQEDAAAGQKLVLPRAAERAIEVVDGDGRPAAGASVVCAVDGSIRATAVTDEKGRASIGTPTDGASVLFVFPRDGSLAIRKLAANDDVRRITIPPARASLEVAAVTDDGAPVANVTLLMRYNGELFTRELAREFRVRHRVSLRTDGDGRVVLKDLPTGFYEFWPFQNEEEEDLLVASSVGVAAPIALHVVAGENRVRVQFEERD